MGQEMREWVEVYPGIEGKVLRTENDLKHILRLWESERKTVGKLAVIDLAATVIALQAELERLRSIEAAALAFPEDMPLAYELDSSIRYCRLCHEQEDPWSTVVTHNDGCPWLAFQTALGGNGDDR